MKKNITSFYEQKLMISALMNNKRQHIFFLILWLVLPGQSGFSQDTVKKDSSYIEVIPFKENIQERYNGNDFNYVINDTGGVNLIQRVLRGFFSWLRDAFGVDVDFIDYNTLEYIVYGLLGLGALYLLIKFLLQSPMSSVFKNDKQTIDGFNYVESDIKEVNFDKLISKAIKQKNFRLATRYLYLKSLKTLTSKNIIEWHYDKTNSDYLNEISDQNTKYLFKRISYIYDYVWYGKFPIDEATYSKNEADFNKLKTIING